MTWYEWIGWCIAAYATVAALLNIIERCMEHHREWWDL